MLHVTYRAVDDLYTEVSDMIVYGPHWKFSPECYTIVITDNVESLYLIRRKKLYWDWLSGEIFDWNKRYRVVSSKYLGIVVLITFAYID